MDAQDADRALESVLADLDTTSTADIASNPHNAICKIMVALVLIGRRLVPARSSATDETVPGRRKPEQARSLASIDPLWNHATGYRLTPPLGGLDAVRQDPPRTAVSDRIEGRAADLAAKDRAELAAALTKLETAERTMATLQNLVAEKDRMLDGFDRQREGARRSLMLALGIGELDTLTFDAVVDRALHRIAVLLAEHQRERTEVDKLRAEIARRDTAHQAGFALWRQRWPERIASMVAVPDHGDLVEYLLSKIEEERREHASHIANLEHAHRRENDEAVDAMNVISDGAALASEVRAADATIAELRKLVCEAQVERDMAMNEACEWRNAHARARLAAWAILQPGVSLAGDRTLAQLLDDVREAMAEVRNENERADDLIEYVLAWHHRMAVHDGDDAKLRTAIDEWLKEPAEAGPLLAEKLATADARWERIQPLIRALHAWSGARPGQDVDTPLTAAFDRWQEAEAKALDAEEAKPTPALRSLFASDPAPTARCELRPGLVRMTEDRVEVDGMAFTPDGDGGVDVPRQPDDPGVERDLKEAAAVLDERHAIVAYLRRLGVRWPVYRAGMDAAADDIAHGSHVDVAASSPASTPQPMPQGEGSDEKLRIACMLAVATATPVGTFDPEIHLDHARICPACSSVLRQSEGGWKCEHPECPVMLTDEEMSRLLGRSRSEL